MEGEQACCSVPCAHLAQLYWLLQATAVSRLPSLWLVPHIPPGSPPEDTQDHASRNFVSASLIAVLFQQKASHVLHSTSQDFPSDQMNSGFWQPVDFDNHCKSKSWLQLWSASCVDPHTLVTSWLDTEAKVTHRNPQWHKNRFLGDL